MPDLRQTSEFSQGDVFALKRLPVVSGIDGGMPEVECVECPNGVMLVNQTCDAVRADLTLGISNSFGFGGHNACVAFRRY